MPSSDEIVPMVQQVDLVKLSNKERFLELMSQGVSKEQACEAIGIKPATVRVWLSRDQDFFRQWHKLSKVSASFHAPAAVERLAKLADDAIAAGDFKAGRRILRDIIEIAGAGPQTGNPTVNIQADNVNIAQLAEVPVGEMMAALKSMAGGAGGEIESASAKVTDPPDADTGGEA